MWSSHIMAVSQLISSKCRIWMFICSIEGWWCLCKLRFWDYFFWRSTEHWIKVHHAWGALWELCVSAPVRAEPSLCSGSPSVIVKWCPDLSAFLWRLEAGGVEPSFHESIEHSRITANTVNGLWALKTIQLEYRNFGHLYQWNLKSFKWSWTLRHLVCKVSVGMVWHIYTS